MLAFAALADPTRRQIVELLTERELPAGEIAQRFDVSAPAISQHLKVLREAGLVSVRADAQRRIYGIDRSGFTELEQWLGRVQQFWAPKLDRLELQLQKENALQLQKENALQLQKENALQLQKENALQLQKELRKRPRKSR